MINNQPLIVQSDHGILAETDHPLYSEVRETLGRFAELVKSPEHIHTYRITSLSLWNAAALGMTAGGIKGFLTAHSKYSLPGNVVSEIDHVLARYGKIELHATGDPGVLKLVVLDPAIAAQVSIHPKAVEFIKPNGEPGEFSLPAVHRGTIKQVLIKIGYPIVDLAGFIEGDERALALRNVTLGGIPFTLRAYQEEAVAHFHQGGTVRGGNGVIVLPCGAGKTVVAMAVMAKIQRRTLILCTSVAAVHQWIRELLDKTDISPEMVGEYTADHKVIRPITVATYHILTYRHHDDFDLKYFDLFNAQNWGLIIYDEVHLLPAPIFRLTAGLQARRRLGLTATLVREDGKEDEVFSLIGPKRYEAPWKILENQGWIAEAVCHELRVPMDEKHKIIYSSSDQRVRFRLAATYVGKTKVVKDLLAHHAGEPTLVIGQYLDQLKGLAQELKVPLITGQTSNSRREELYEQFRTGKIWAMVVSRVANFSIDLPEARVLIQVSGAFGSRQEEAQRLGRILRPKAGGGAANFYTLVSTDTVEQEFGLHRQIFLAEQGYRYAVRDIEIGGGPCPV